MQNRQIAIKSQRGQGLVEYALIVGLVSVVALIALGAIGWATKQGFGVIVGALGVKKDVNAPTNFMYFDTNQPPVCGYLEGSNQTGLYVQFFTDVDTGALTVRTDMGFQTNIAPGTGGAANYYQVAVPLAIGDHPEVCPHSVVIQSSKETGDLMAVSPIGPPPADWTP